MRNSAFLKFVASAGSAACAVNVLEEDPVRDDGDALLRPRLQPTQKSSALS